MADIVADSVDLASAEEPGGLLGLGGPEVVPLEVVPFAMLVADRSGRVRTVNRRWVEMTGLDLEASAGSGWLEALRPEDRPAVEAAVACMARTSSPRRAEFRWGAPQGGSASWWLASVDTAGERLVGIAVGPGPIAENPPASGLPPAVAAPATPATPATVALSRPGWDRPDPVLRELPGLLRSFEALLSTLDRLVDRLPVLEAVPA